MKFDVITFGSAVADVFVSTDVAEKKSLICYDVGSKILIKDLKFDIGGGGTNTAVAFSRLGLKTGCICKVGNDENGREILASLLRDNVKFLGSVDKFGMSGFSVILDSKEKNRTILTYKGINDTIGLEDIPLRKLKTNWIYFTSLLGKSYKTQVKLAKLLKSRGTKIAFNPSEYLIKKINISALLKLSDIIILNKEEAEFLTRKRKNLLEHLHNLTAKNSMIVITDKNKKISCFNGKKKYFLIPNKIKVVERTGAGDAFASGFVAGQIVGKTIQQSLKLGLRESESVIRYFGAKNRLLEMRLK